MMRLKRGFLVLAAAAMVAAVMSGCPSGGGGVEPPPDNPDFRITLDRQGTLNLGSAYLGYQADVLTPLEVTVTNAGTEPTGQLSVTLGGSTAFAVSPTIMVSIAAGSTGRFTVTPVVGMSVGTHSATVTVSGANDISASFVATFTVNERPPRGITLVGMEASHDFPSLLEGYAAHALTPLNVVVRNIGLEPTGDLTVAVSSANFEATVATIPSLAVDADGNFDVSPIVGLTEALHSATVTVSGTAAGLDPVSFEVTFRVDAVRDIVPDITDPVLLGIIRQAMNIPTGPIYNNQAALVDDITAVTAYGVNITSLAGLQHFTGLEVLQLPHNLIEEIDFAFHPLLQLVNLSENRIREIDIRGLAYLEIFIYDGLHAPGDRRIHEFLLGNNPVLRVLDIPNHQISAIDLRAVPSLQTLIIRNNVNLAPDRIDVTGNPNLIELNVNFMHFLNHPAGLTTLDVTQNPLLRHLQVAGNPIATLDLSNNTELEVLWMRDTNISEIAFTQLRQLREIHATNTQLVDIDFRQSPNLVIVQVGDTAVQQIRFPDSNPNLVVVLVGRNPNLSELTINNAPNLRDVDVSENMMNRLTLRNNPSLDMVIADTNDFGSSDNIDFTGSDAIRMVAMSHDPSGLPNLSMTHFDTSILPDTVETLFLTGHRQIVNLNFANLPNLVEFQANRIGLNSLDLTGNPRITMWRSLFNNISGTVDLTQNPELWNFWSTGGNITQILVSGSRLGWRPPGSHPANTAVNVSNNIMTSVDDVVGRETQTPPLVFATNPGQDTFMFLPQRVPPLVTMASGGSGASFAVMSDGTLWSWGSNSNGRTGTGSTTSLQTTPAPVFGGLEGWVHVSSRNQHTLAIREVAGGRHLYAWGNSANGRLGIAGAEGNVNRPTRVGTDTDWLSVSAGGAFSVGIKTDGTLWFWGSQQFTAFGATDNILVPTRLGNLDDWVAVSAGDVAVGAIREVGTERWLYMWGNNTEGELGPGILPLPDWSVSPPILGPTEPVRLGTDTNWESISIGNSFALAIRSVGTERHLYSWGRTGRNTEDTDGDGRLGQGPVTTELVQTPTRVGTYTDWHSASAGNYFGVGLRGTSGNLRLMGWGSNQGGRAGQGIDDHMVRTLVPTQIGTYTDWTFATASSNNHGLAIRPPLLFGWGSNTDRALGLPGAESRTSPVLIPVP